MIPYFDCDGLVLYQGDAVARLREMAADSVDLCVTSPPFWNLRDYGTDGQIGLEETPDLWAEALAAVFEEVRRVLRPTGVLLVECGDSYASSSTYNATNSMHSQFGWKQDGECRPNAGTPDDLKAKDLIGQPFLLAFALRSAGWWWRGVYPWAKPNPMPESVEDRCTTSHSYILHFSKRERYFWDGYAIADPVASPNGGGRQRAAGTDRYADTSFKSDDEQSSPVTSRFQTAPVEATRNARSVWTIATEHSALGLCPVCRAFWVRNAPEKHCGVDVVQHYACVDEETEILTAEGWKGHDELCVGELAAQFDLKTQKLSWAPLLDIHRYQVRDQEMVEAQGRQLDFRITGNHRCVVVKQQRGPGQKWGDPQVVEADALRRAHGYLGSAPWDIEGRDEVSPEWAELLGWYIAEGHESKQSSAVEVYQSETANPFAGSGTTLLAARRLGRHGIGVEINGDYCEMTARRLRVPEAVARAAETSAEPTQLVIG